MLLSTYQYKIQFTHAKADGLCHLSLLEHTDHIEMSHKTPSVFNFSHIEAVSIISSEIGSATKKNKITLQRYIATLSEVDLTTSAIH